VQRIVCRNDLEWKTMATNHKRNKNNCKGYPKKLRTPNKKKREEIEAQCLGDDKNAMTKGGVIIKSWCVGVAVLLATTT